MIRVKLPYPPTVNHYYTVVRGRKILSKKGRAFKATAMAYMLEQRCGKAKGRLEVKIDLFPPDNRRRDLDNTLKPILDVLSTSASACFDDDSQIDRLCIYRRPVAKDGFVNVQIGEMD